eukprot:TRINITY_DN56115_c0_g1_i1.p1 TRINITY_DN56115_c0_g1~~TRINITY_DN56115_c0_g1_i1.p1  ORF type:complete len:176 (+),score=31.66 TRINITY_DN56115_c0_g1_i1:71-529(+)
MDRYKWLFSAALREQEALAVVRKEVHAEIENEGKKMSERQRQVTSWQQVDFVPNICGLVSGLASIALFRKAGFMSKGNRFLVLLPAAPCYLFPHQLTYHVRETEYLVEMMREDNKFGRKLRASFEAANSGHNRPSAILEELESGSDIPDDDE